MTSPEPVPGPKRLAALERLYGASSSQAQAVAAEEMRYADELERFKEPGAEVRVWYSDAPDELCGFAFLMDLLTQIHFGGPVWAVKQPCPNISPDGSGGILSRLGRGWAGVLGALLPAGAACLPKRAGRMELYLAGTAPGKRAAPGSDQRPAHECSNGFL